MSGAVVVTMAGASVAAAAAAVRARQEEEEMTKYNTDELDGWEFKIVRSATRKFKHRDFVRELCQEEAKAGWQMLEKFDDNRIRFKRRVEKRDQDHYLQSDPYRTNVGISAQSMGVVFTAIGVGLAVLGVFAALFFSRSDGGGDSMLPWLVLSLIVVLGVAVILVVIMRARSRKSGSKYKGTS